MILKDLATPNGPAKYHSVHSMSCKPPFTAIVLQVNSYLDESTYLAGGNLMCQHQFSMPATGLAGNLGDLAESWLVTAPGSLLQGGQVVADKSNTLDAARDRAWSAIKAARSRAEAGNFTFDGGIYQINVGQVGGCVLAAKLAKDAGAPFSQDWTLFDNSVRTLDADHMIAMGLAMLAAVDGIYKTGRALRDQIDAAASIDTVEAIAWPV